MDFVPRMDPHFSEDYLHVRFYGQGRDHQSGCDLLVRKVCQASDLILASSQVEGIFCPSFRFRAGCWFTRFKFSLVIILSDQQTCVAECPFTKPVQVDLHSGIPAFAIRSPVAFRSLAGTALPEVNSLAGWAARFDLATHFTRSPAQADLLREQHFPDWHHSPAHLEVHGPTPGTSPGCLFPATRIG